MSEYGAIQGQNYASPLGQHWWQIRCGMRGPFDLWVRGSD